MESNWRPPHPLLDWEWAGIVPLCGALSFTLIPSPPAGPITVQVPPYSAPAFFLFSPPQPRPF